MTQSVRKICELFALCWILRVIYPKVLIWALIIKTDAQYFWGFFTLYHASQSWDWLRHVLKRFNRQGAYTLQYLDHCTDRGLMKNKMLNRILVSRRPISLQIQRRQWARTKSKQKLLFLAETGFLRFTEQRLFKLTKKHNNCVQSRDDSNSTILGPLFSGWTIPLNLYFCQDTSEQSSIF